MKLLPSILLALALCSGCVTTKSPERIAHTVASASVTTADAAIRAWFVGYVQPEVNRIDAMRRAGNSKYITARSELTKKEGRVLEAWETYRAAADTFVRQSAAGETPSAAIRDAAEVALIQLVNQLSK